MRIPIDDYFVKRLISGVQQAHAWEQATEHGEDLEWGRLARNLAEFAQRVDPEMSPSQLMFQMIWAQALVETISAIAKELGVTDVEAPDTLEL